MLNINMIDLKDNKTLTYLIILLVILFGLCYVWQSRGSVMEGFETYTVLQNDNVILPKLDNVILSSENNINALNKINNLINSNQLLNQNKNNIDTLTATVNSLGDIKSTIDNLTTTVNNNNATTQTALTQLRTSINSLNNSLSFVGEINYRVLANRLAITTMYNIPGQYFLELFNYNNSNLQKPYYAGTSIASTIPNLPPLQPNTTYIIHLNTTAYSSYLSGISIFCIDNLGKPISEINGNNRNIVSDSVRADISVSFKATTGATTNNLIIGLGAETGFPAQDINTGVSIIIYKLNKI